VCAQVTCFTGTKVQILTQLGGGQAKYLGDPLEIATFAATKSALREEVTRSKLGFYYLLFYYVQGDPQRVTVAN
jgi:hypothetical protein